MDRDPEKDDEGNIDFEIQFYEGMIKDNPNFIQALTAIGDLYTKKGLYEKGLEIDQRLAQLKPDDPCVFYNLSCSYSLLSRVDQAFDAIKKAIELGYDDFEYLQEDQDLHNLRKDNRFIHYFSDVRNKKFSQHEP